MSTFFAVINWCWMNTAGWTILKFRMSRASRSNATLIPRQSRGLYFVSRSKRLCGVADAAPVIGNHLHGGWLQFELQLIQSFVFFLLVPYIVPDHGFIAAHR